MDYLEVLHALIRGPCSSGQALHPADAYLDEAWWVALTTLDALGESACAEAALRRGHAWVAEGLRVDVPPEFVPSFIDRNPVNRALLAAAGRRLGLRTPQPITAQ